MSGLPEAGAGWGPFHLLEEVGACGPARLFVAWDPVLCRRVALDTLDAATGAPAVERFLREAGAGGLDHPRVAPVRRVGRQDAVPYAVIDLVPGGDLAAEMARGPLPAARVSAVVEQVAEALDHAHGEGLVHGSLSPTEVLCLDGTDDVVLAGFGRPAGHGSHRPAPEQRTEAAPVPASDIHALGCLARDALAGRLDLPAVVDDVVARATSEDPADRHASAGALAAALREALDEVDAGPPEPMPPEPIAPAAVVLARQASEPVGGRSVFDETAVLRATPVLEGRRRVVDGAIYGVYEDDAPTSRAPAIIAAVVTFAALVVAGLVVWAVNTDADLDLPATGPTTTVAPSVPPPSVEELALLVPPGIGDCAPPAEQPTDDPPRVLLQCAPDGAPEVMNLFLYGTVEDRDEAFDAVLAFLRVPPGGEGDECALGRPAAHDYLGVEQVGRVACQSANGRTDFVWTSDAAPLLAIAGGGGRYGEHYRWWEALVDRTDAAFPLGVEQVLLDHLPEQLLVDCHRDVDLAIEAPGEVAVACRPEGVPAGTVSWVQFTGSEPMDAWIDRHRATLGDVVVGESATACSPDGFGRADVEVGIDDSPSSPADAAAPPPTTPPAPTAGHTDYDLGGRTGTVLCWVAPDRRKVVVWVRDGTLIGSIAVAGADAGVTMADLLRWWETAGHLP